MNSRLFHNPCFIRLLGFSLIHLLLIGPSTLFASSANYTAAPPFVATNVGKPNVVIALDISGSMKAVAYRDTGAGNWKKGLHDDFNPDYSYYGYFETDALYSYDDDFDKQFFYQDATGAWNGNFLNWLTMRRMDVVRKVLVGGKVSDRNGEVIDGDTWYILEGQHEPLDHTFRKSYSNSSSYSPIANDQELLISEGKFALTTGNAATIVQLSDKVEIGQVSIDRDITEADGDWRSVTFENTYATPPAVVVTGLSFNGADPTVARARNITTTGFEVHLEEWEYRDGNHTTEEVVFIVADTASAPYKISVGGTGYIVAAGKRSTNKTYHGIANRELINYGITFPTAPVVFTGVSSDNDITAVTTRISNVTTNSFFVSLQEEEAEWNNNHGTEEVHWVAFEKLQGISDTAGVRLVVDDTPDAVTEAWYDISFPSSFFVDPPMIAVKMQTLDGNNTATTRYGDSPITIDGFDVKIEEEKSFDDELAHTTERVGYLAIEKNVAYKIRLGLSSEPTGIIQDNSGSIRFGLAVYNFDHTRTPTSVYNGNSTHGGTMRPCYPDVSKIVSERTNFDICLDTHVKSPLSNIINVIEDYPLIWGTTPIAETLYDIKGYFAQTDHNRGTNSHNQWYDNGTEGIVGTASDGDPKERNSYEISDDWDPYYYPEYGQRLPCAKSFVLHFNDGAPYTDFDGTGHPTLTSDGVGGSGENEALDELALMLRNTDCRPETGMPGHQDIISYYVYAALGENESNNTSTKRMREAAANGGFVDADEDNLPDPAHPANFINYINAGNCTANEWDEDGDCSPDTFYFANDGERLEQELNAAFESITARAGSGGASSVIAASRSGEGAVFNAIFRPSVSSGGDEVSWIGDVHALLIDSAGNIRQDDGDRVLEDATSDKYVDMCSFEEGDVKEVRIKLSESLGDRPTQVQSNECSATVFDKTLFDLEYLWSGASWLADLTDSQAAGTQRAYTATTRGRYILTGIDANGDGLIVNSEVQDFMPSTFDSTKAGLISNSLSDATDVINWIRGQDISGLRSRQLNGKTQRLGDIIYSTPTVVGRPAENLDLIYGSASYKSFFNRYRYRRQVVYAGGNDGMLHAFNGGWYDPSDKEFKNAKGSSAPGSNTNYALGTELWAYVPYHGLAHLEYLTRPSYGTVSSDHLYFMDLEPRIFDAKIFPNDADHPGGWGTVLVVGSRLGGGQMVVDADLGATVDTRTLTSSYAIIDITNPDVAPRVLLEFTHPDLGFTTSIPAPLVVGANSEGTGDWYLMLGSGADTSAAGFEDVKSTQNAKLFLLDLKAIVDGTGVLKTSFGTNGIYTLPDSNSFISDLSAVDFGLDNYTTDAVYFGTVSGTPGSWGGKIYRVKIQSETGATQTDVSTWAPTLVYDATRPVTAAVSLSTDSVRNRWLHVGTGRFFTRTDNLDNSVNYFYGLKEPRSTTGAFNYSSPSIISDVSSTTVNSSSAVLNSPPVLSPALPSGATVETLEGRMKDYTSSSQYVDGWKRSLAAGEKNFGAATVFGGTLTFTTYDPVFDECSIEGTARLYIMNMLTGTAGSQAIVSQSSTATTNTDVIELGSNPATTPSLHIGDGYSTDKNSKAIIQTSDGSILTVEQTNSEAVRSGEVSWRQLQ